MMRKTIVVTAAAFLVGAGACLAQPAGITRDMISRALPLEGAPKAEPGPYQTTSEAAFGAPGFHVYRPAALEAFPSKEALPVMVWGNGGCNINSTNFAGYLTTIASHGVLVIGTVPVEGAANRQENADDMRAAIDWAAKENARAGSPLNGKIAMDKVAVMGTSCGGFLTLTLGADPRVKTSACSIPACRSKRPPRPRKAKARVAARRSRPRPCSPRSTSPYCSSTAAMSTS
jgi:hypothetical protein